MRGVRTECRTLLLTEPMSHEMVPGMARLLRTIGVPVLNLLEARLYDSRKQRVSAAIKLLAATDPERLLRGVDRAIAAWEWNLQDLAVSELSRPTNSASAQSAAGIFARVLADAHPLVVPMMIDQIGLAMEFTAVPQLMEIASGEHELLRDQFVRIKAIEALGRMRAVEAIELLRSLAEKREGITYVEPGGLRAAAEDALAMMEDREGNVWVGTETGLARFDGISFTLFDKTTSPALPGNDIRCLLATADGALWIGTSEGLARWSGGALTAWTTREGLPGNAILALNMDADGGILVSTGSGDARIQGERVTPGQ